MLKPKKVTNDEIWPIGSPPPNPEEFINKVGEILGAAGAAAAVKQQILSNTNGNLDYRFADLPDSALDGRLGEICFNQMPNFPLAYSWPALLAVASSMIEERTMRTNMYCALVGPVHSGKSQAVEHALKILGLQEPVLMETMSGSAEQLVRKTKDAHGATRLFSPDELGHLFEKMHIENSSYSYILNSAYYKDKFEVLMGKKEIAQFNCVLSIVGGIVEDKFDKLFDASSTAGLYDRFLFGYVQGESNYDYKPFEGEVWSGNLTRVIVGHDVWEEKSRWIKANQDWNPRVIENAIRAAAICASFSGRTCLRAEDLGPAYELVKYQMLIRDTLKPNPGENYEGKLAHKFLGYLARLGGAFIGRRDLIRHTRAYDYGPSVADRALGILKSNGDIEMIKRGKKICVRLVTEQEHTVDAGPVEEE